MGTQIEKDILRVIDPKNKKAHSSGDGAKKGESREDYLRRLATAMQEVSEDEWESLPDAAQHWCNDVIEAIKEDKTIPEPEDAEDEAGEGETEGEEGSEGEGEEEPAQETRRGRRSAKEKDEPAPAAKKADKKDTKAPAKKDTKADAKADKKDAKAPAKKATGKADEKPEPKPARRGGKDEPAPASAKKGAGSKPTEAEPKQARISSRKPEGAQAMIKTLIIKNPRLSTDDLLAQLGKKGFNPTKLAVSTIRSGMIQTLKLLDAAGHLKGIELG